MLSWERGSRNAFAAHTYMLEAQISVQYIYEKNSLWTYNPTIVL